MNAKWAATVLAFVSSAFGIAGVAALLQPVPEPEKAPAVTALRDRFKIGTVPVGSSHALVVPLENPTGRPLRIVGVGTC